MKARFCMLASGSAGNSGLLKVGGACLLVDAGLGPRLAAARLAAVGATWNDVRAAVITHTHADHCKAPTVGHLAARRIPLHCHAGHHHGLLFARDKYFKIKAAGLLYDFECRAEFSPLPGVTCRSLEVSHDSRPTVAFRFDGPPSLFGPAWSMAYVTDLGCWTDGLVELVRGVDLLAVEFNHDADMERRSGRAAYLVKRVLGDRGHLSNVEAAEFLDKCLEASGPGRLKHLVQLHLSRDCNRPALAVDAARRVLRRHGCDARLLTASQGRPTAVVDLVPTQRPARPRTVRPRLARPPRPRLPGFDDTLGKAG